MTPQPIMTVALISHTNTLFYSRVLVFPEEVFLCYSAVSVLGLCTCDGYTC